MLTPYLMFYQKKFGQTYVRTFCINKNQLCFIFPHSSPIVRRLMAEFSLDLSILVSLSLLQMIFGVISWWMDEAKRCTPLGGFLTCSWMVIAWWTRVWSCIFLGISKENIQVLVICCLFFVIVGLKPRRIMLYNPSIKLHLIF